MNENDLSDLVFKNKKEWGFQNKAHTCKKCTKATASKKILVYKNRSTSSNSDTFVSEPLFPSKSLALRVFNTRVRKHNPLAKK